MVEGKGSAGNVKARLASKGYQHPDLKDGLEEASGRFIIRPSHVLTISLGDLNTWNIWRLGIENASLRADDSGREVFLRAPAGWGPKSTRRICTSHAPAFRLNDAPVVPATVFFATR